MKQFLQALRVLAPAVQAKNTAAMRIAGLAHSGNRDWQSAADALRQYVAVVTDDSESWRLLADALFALGDYDDALRAARESYQLSPGDQSARSAVAQSLVMARHYDEAADFCRGNNVALPPDLLAILLLETRQLDLASEHLQQWIAAQPRNVYAWMAMGHLDELTNNYENAQTHYQQALSVKPDHRPAMEALRRVAYILEIEGDAEPTLQPSQLTMQPPR